MAQTASDNVVCISCGSDVRADALFCYNCGSAIVTTPENEETRTQDFDVTEEKSAFPVGGVPSENPANAIHDIDQPAPRRALTAAMLRRKKAYNRRPVEVVWQSPERDSKIFVISSFVLTALAVLILAASLYLK